MPTDDQQMTGDVLLSVMRRRNGLVAWISSSLADGSAKEYCSPVEEVLPALFPQRDALLTDWDTLRHARRLEDAWPAFWRVFWNTSTEAHDHSPLAMPQQIAPPARRSPTAAHPRAFRGTRFQPPKSSSTTLDLCAWLADDRVLDGFFARHDFSCMPALDRDGQPLTTRSDPQSNETVSGFLARDAGVAVEKIPVLPAAFRRFFLWQLRTRPHAQLLEWLT